MKWIIAITTLMFCQIATAQDDKVLYYSSGDTSVHYLEEKKGVQIIELYDLYGNKTFTLEEVHLSYRVSNKFEFYKNGAVEKVVQKSFPGGSPNWCETILHFSSTNEPILKKVILHEQTNSGFSKVEKYFWDKKKNRWRKQEVISCNPIQDK